MMHFFKYVAYAYLALCAQAVFFKGTRPDLVLVLVCMYAPRYGQVKGTAYGALTGLIIDAVSGFALGPNLLSKAAAGFWVSAISAKIFHWNILVNTLVVTAFSFIDIVLVKFCLETFADISFESRPWGIAVAQIIMTVVAALLMYVLWNPAKDGRENSAG
jgi:rod shape-determining protein MreD